MADQPQQPTPPTPLNATHVAAASGATAMLAGVLVWLTNWPIKPLDPATALDVAGLLTGLFGGGGVLLSNSGKNPPSPPPPASPVHLTL